jgi:hypothetical protein
MLLTMMVALHIGIKQNQINEKLLSISLYPSVAVAYDSKQKRINVHNESNSNVWLYGTRYSDRKRNIKDNPVLIPPKGSYYILGENFDVFVRSKLNTEKQTFMPLDLYIKAADGNMYVVYNRLLCMMKNDVVEIHSQTIGIVPEDWSQPTD